jgi:hypothetical protein
VSPPLSIPDRQEGRVVAQVDREDIGTTGTDEATAGEAAA